MEEEDNLDVGEAGESGEAVRAELRRVKINPASNAAPDIVDRVHDGAVDRPDWANLNLAFHSRIVAAEIYPNCVAFSCSRIEPQPARVRLSQSASTPVWVKVSSHPPSSGTISMKTWVISAE